VHKAKATTLQRDPGISVMNVLSDCIGPSRPANDSHDQPQTARALPSASETQVRRLAAASWC